MFVADDVHYHSVAATAGRVISRHHRCRLQRVVAGCSDTTPWGQRLACCRRACPKWFILWRAVSTRSYRAIEVRCSNLIYKYKSHAE